MLWLPRVDEKPYSISGAAPGRIAVTVRRRGPFSTQISGLRPGESLGVRGPYGNGFAPRTPLVLVAGGCGIASLAVLKDRVPDAVLIAGAKTASELLFHRRFPDMLLCTDDGSEGRRGFPTDLLRPLLAEGKTQMVCTCGPEVMMRAVFDLCETFRVPCQAGLERYMKCGFGVCGQCACGDRLVCQDGPVFDSSVLRTLSEFGRTARLKTGKVVPIERYNRTCSV